MSGTLDVKNRSTSKVMEKIRGRSAYQMKCRNRFLRVKKYVEKTLKRKKKTMQYNTSESGRYVVRDNAGDRRKHEGKKKKKDKCTDGDDE